VEVLDEVDVSITDMVAVNAVAASNGRANAPTEHDKEQTKQQTLAIRFIRGTNENHKSYLMKGTLLFSSVCYQFTNVITQIFTTRSE
jgi:hypothetical protein